MTPYKKTILICLLITLSSGIALYYLSNGVWEDIVSGIFTGAIMSVITTSVLYNVKKDEIFTNIGKELLSTYWRLSYLYAQLIKCANKLKGNEGAPNVIYKEIAGTYKVYEKYMENNNFDFALNNYDGLLFSSLINKFFISKEVKVLVNIRDMHQINKQYALLCGDLSIMRLELDLAEKSGNIEQINNIIMRIDTQYNYSLNTIPQQLAFINYAMKNFEKIKKINAPWNEMKQDILNRNGLFDNKINEAEYNFQPEYKRK